VLLLLHRGGFIGQAALTREPVTGSAYAIGEVTALQIDRNTLEQLVSGKPGLLQDLSQAIDERRDRAREAAAQVEHHAAATDSAE
jgi:CRP-like cAMP-binding protein